METPYELVPGLDRSETKANLCLIATLALATAARRVMATAPEALWEWLIRQERLGKLNLGMNQKPRTKMAEESRQGNERLKPTI